MPVNCTRCQGTGFINTHQLPDDIDGYDQEAVLKFIKEEGDHDVSICDCCGNSDEWYGIPGQHYNSEDPIGRNGPYAYNGGLCECH